MFLGHFALGFAAKRAAPQMSLGALFLAAQFADLLWPTLLLTGIERVEIRPGITAATPLDFVSYPVSHSLLALALWGGLFALVARLLGKAPRAGWVLGGLVVSHWVLDLIVHRPDLPLAPGLGVRLGLGLWSSVPATFLLEMAVFLAGLVVYYRSTRAIDPIGSTGLGALAGFLLVVFLGNMGGSPPPNVPALIWVGQAQWLLVLWGYWIDAHRRPAIRQPVA